MAIFLLWVISTAKITHRIIVGVCFIDNEAHNLKATSNLGCLAPQGVCMLGLTNKARDWWALHNLVRKKGAVECFGSGEKFKIGGGENRSRVRIVGKKKPIKTPSSLFNL